MLEDLVQPICRKIGGFLLTFPDLPCRVCAQLLASEQWTAARRQGSAVRLCSYQNHASWEGGQSFINSPESCSLEGGQSGQHTQQCNVRYSAAPAPPQSNLTRNHASWEGGQSGQHTQQCNVRYSFFLICGTYLAEKREERGRRWVRLGREPILAALPTFPTCMILVSCCPLCPPSQLA